MSPILSLILTHLIEIVGSLVMLGIAPALHYLVKMAATHFDYKIDQTKEQNVTAVIVKAIGNAEEWATSKVKSGTALPSGLQKLETAIKFVQDELARMGYEQIAKDKIQQLIEAQLGLSKVVAPPVVVTPPVVLPPSTTP